MTPGWRVSAGLPGVEPAIHDVRVEGTLLRKATENDQAAITALVRQARLNPRGLAWPAFLVADRDGEVVGAVQLRPHDDGARELASLVVRPDHRGHGIGMALLDRLLADEPGTVYVVTEREHAEPYERRGFSAATSSSLPRSMRRQLRIGRVATAILSIPAQRRIRLVPLRRAAV
jgi:N-acetylglutamate synthase-like GNAT family acetyltransferase